MSKRRGNGYFDGGLTICVDFLSCNALWGMYRIYKTNSWSKRWWCGVVWFGYWCRMLALCERFPSTGESDGLLVVSKTKCSKKEDTPEQ